MKLFTESSHDLFPCDDDSAGGSHDQLNLQVDPLRSDPLAMSSSLTPLPKKKRKYTRKTFAGNVDGIHQYATRGNLNLVRRD